MQHPNISDAGRGVRAGSEKTLQKPLAKKPTAEQMPPEIWHNVFAALSKDFDVYNAGRTNQAMWREANSFDLPLPKQRLMAKLADTARSGQNESFVLARMQQELTLHFQEIGSKYSVLDAISMIEDVEGLSLRCPYARDNLAQPAFFVAMHQALLTATPDYREYTLFSSTLTTFYIIDTQPLAHLGLLLDSRDQTRLQQNRITEMLFSPPRILHDLSMLAAIPIAELLRETELVQQRTIREREVEAKIGAGGGSGWNMAWSKDHWGMSENEFEESFGRGMDWQERLLVDKLRHHDFGRRIKMGIRSVGTTEVVKLFEDFARSENLPASTEDIETVFHRIFLRTLQLTVQANSADDLLKVTAEPSKTELKLRATNRRIENEILAKYASVPTKHASPSEAMQVGSRATLCALLAETDFAQTLRTNVQDLDARKEQIHRLLPVDLSLALAQVRRTHRDAFWQLEARVADIVGQPYHDAIAAEYLEDAPAAMREHRFFPLLAAMRTEVRSAGYQRMLRAQQQRVRNLAGLEGEAASEPQQQAGVS